MQTQTPAAAAPAAPKLFTLHIPAIGADWPEHGGKFGGIVFKADGSPGHLIIVGPQSPQKDEHAKQLAWAQGLQLHGFADWDLPDCIQGHVLAANRAALDFEPYFYWLKERHAEDSGYAWCQCFDDGFQDFINRGISLRARAVRTIAI